jgi:preprotein translocase subunit YajC
MFISPAYAQTPGAPGGFDIMTIVPLILIFVVFYFLLIRPQQKKVKEHRDMVTNLRRGDRIVTSGGIIGKITKVVSEGELQIEIAEGVRVRCARAMIANIYARTEEEGEGEDGDKAANDKS